MSNEPVSVAVFGATGLLGESVLAALGEVERPLAVHALGGVARSARVDGALLGTRPIPVHPASKFPELQFGIAVLCLPPKAASLIGPALVQRGIFVIDAADAAGLTAPLWFPSGTLPDDTLRAGGVRLPCGPGALLARVGAALRPAGLRGMSGTVLLGAGRAGRAAMEELGQQVIATFAQKDPTRVHFPEGLAFDVLPEAAELGAASAAEQRAQTQAASLSGLDSSAVALSFLTVPMFSGVVASLHLRGVSAEAAAVALSEAPGLVAPERPAELRPRAVEGETKVHWGRLRPDPGGDGVLLQCVADPLALTSSLVAEAVTRAGDAGFGRSRA
jgi:aspartate-semialdehyde dehydrogenase